MTMHRPEPDRRGRNGQMKGMKMKAALSCLLLLCAFGASAGFAGSWAGSRTERQRTIARVMEIRKGTPLAQRGLVPSSFTGFRPFVRSFRVRCLLPGILGLGVWFLGAAALLLHQRPPTHPGEEQKLILEKLLGLEPSFRQLAVLDERGRELIRVSRLSYLASSQLKERDGEMFSRVSQGETYVSSVYIDEVTSEPMVVMAVPDTDVFGDFEGVLIAEVNLKFMWDMVGRMEIGRNGLAYVVDKQGNLIASGDISRVLKKENLMHLREVNEFVTGDEAKHVSTADTSTGIQGTQVVSNHAHLGSPDWAVVVELPVDEVYEAVNLEILLAVLIIALNVVLAILAGVYLSRRITRPLSF